MTASQRIGALVLAVVAASAACRRSSATPPPPPTASAPQTAAPAAAAALDTRRPVPLTATMATHQKAEMRDHLLVVQEIAAALARQDFDAIAASAARIAWSERQAEMCKRMGAGAPGVAEAGEHFHKTADGIVAAARRRDAPGVVAALDGTLQTCVGCHATYRQDIVEDAAFSRATGLPDTSCPMHAH